MSSRTARRCGQLGSLHQFDRWQARDDDLRDAVAVMQLVRIEIAKGPHRHEHLASVVRIDRAERHSHSPEREAGARPHLNVTAGRRLEGKARRHELRMPPERQRRVNTGVQVEA
jgi:hypothetical protein